VYLLIKISLIRRSSAFSYEGAPDQLIARFVKMADPEQLSLRPNKSLRKREIKRISFLSRA